MAFQTGTKVDPRLMKADLSGFSRGTELAMAGIGAAIKGYAAKKKENEQVNFASESLAGQAKENPYVRQLFGISDEEAENITAADFKPIVKGYGAKTALGLSAQINMLTTKAAMEGGDPADISSLMNAAEKLNLKQNKKTGELELASAPFGTSKKIKSLDQYPQVQVLRKSDPKLFDQLYGSQFGATTNAAPSADMSADFGFEDFSFEEID
jgi:hypothetical protein